MQEIGTESNAITGMPEMSWRGLQPPPYDTANFSGGFALARAEYPFVNGVSHDNMGAAETKLPFHFMFINTAQRNVFPALFSEWAKAVIVDGTPGKLVHPMLGEMDARVDTWEVEVTASMTAGVVMTVNFVHSILNPEEAQQFTGTEVSAKALAANGDDGMEKLGIDYPTGERTTSLTDMINQLDSLAFQARTKVQGFVNQAQGVLDNIIETVENLQDHAAWALAFNLKALKFAIDVSNPTTATNPLQALRATAVYMTSRTMSLTEVAKETGNKLGEIMALNPALLGAPVVANGTPVLYFTE